MSVVTETVSCGWCERCGEWEEALVHVHFPEVIPDEDDVWAREEEAEDYYLCPSCSKRITQNLGDDQ
jgi:hypothetical protein